jgi:hypothetical protein
LRMNVFATQTNGSKRHILSEQVDKKQ